MFDMIKQIFKPKNKDIQKRILFTLVCLFVFVIGKANPMELYLVFPIVVLLTTTMSAFLTSLYTRKIKSSDTANIE